MAKAAQSTFYTSNLTKRLITAALGGPLVIFFVLLGGLPFSLLMIAVGMNAGAEFLYMARADLRRSIAQTALTIAIGIAYIGLPLATGVVIRGSEALDVWIVLVIVLTWGTDTFSYIGGRLFGKTPLSPTISPGKTVEGAVAGYVGAVAIALVVLGLNDAFTSEHLLFIAIGPIAAILGDLFESALKRRFAVKDSQIPGFNLLPGHGGILDRIDSLLFVLIVCWVFLLLRGLP